MKIACVCMVLLTAAAARGKTYEKRDCNTLWCLPDDMANLSGGTNSEVNVEVSPPGDLVVINGYGAKVAICATGGEGAAKVACKGVRVTSVDPDELVHARSCNIANAELSAMGIEYGIDVACTGSEGSLNECTSANGPGPLASCGNSFVGCA